MLVIVGNLLGSARQPRRIYVCEFAIDSSSQFWRKSHAIVYWYGESGWNIVSLICRVYALTAGADTDNLRVGEHAVRDC